MARLRRRTIETPEEALEAAHLKMRMGLASELLARVKGASSHFFERLVVELLVKMGYGGSRRDAGQAFITTGTFSGEAVGYVEHIDPKVVLIDGRRLADLMMDYDVGVNTSATYSVKRVDSDYFDETGVV